jgi:hypothetical protein
MGTRLTSAELDAMETSQPRRFTTAELEAMQPQKSDDELRREAVQQTFDESTGLQKFGIGVAKPFVEGFHGARRMLGGEADPEAEARLRAIRGPAATAGEVVGNVAGFAVPGAAVTKIGKGALLADAALNAVGSGLQSEGRGEGFGRGAAWGAAGSGIGAAIGKGVNAARSGLRELFTLRPGAREAIEKGIQLTPGQAANGTIQRIENAAANVPVVGTPVRDLQRESVSGWNRTILQDVAPNPSAVTKGGHEGFQQVTKQFGDAYDDLFARDLPTGQVDSAIRELVDNTRLDASTASFLRDVANDFGGDVINGQRLSELDDQLRKMAVAASRGGRPTDADAINAVREKIIRGNLPKDFTSKWGDLDSQFRKFATTRRAATYQNAARNAGVFTPAELLRAAAAQDKSAGKRKFAQGIAPLQKAALEAEDMFQLPSRGLAEQLSAPVGIGAAIVNPVATAGAFVGSRAAINEPVRQAIINKMLKNKPLTPQELEQAVRMGITLGGAAGATSE